MEKFDDEVWSIFLKLIGDTSLKCCESVVQRARARAFLASRHGGVGLKEWGRTVDFAWFTSVASSVGVADPDLDYARKFLGKKATDAYEWALDSLGGPSYLSMHGPMLIPVGEGEETVLSNSSFYQELFEDDEKLRLQHAFCEISSKRAQDEYIGSVNFHTTRSEQIAVASMKSGESVLASLFTADLSQVDTRLSKVDFVVAVRQFLCLPPLPRPGCRKTEKACG